MIKFVNNRGSTIILITVLVLTATLTITLTAAQIVQSGIYKGRTQINSTKAYFAAEAGAERILYDIRQAGFDIETDPACSSSGTCVVFNSPDTCDDTCTDINISQTFGNGAIYRVEYFKDGLDNVINCYGTFSDVTRAVELKY